jgi:hypothetical protein
MLLTIVIACFTFAAGTLLGRQLRAKTKSPYFVQASVPIATLVADFEDFARNYNDGELSIETDAALKVLKAHAEQKYLKAAPAKKFDGWQGKRADEWSDLRCFEKEMSKASNDDERLSVIQHWLIKYNFNQAWQTWSIDQMSSLGGREKLRSLFTEQ